MVPSGKGPKAHFELMFPPGEEALIVQSYGAPQ